MASMFRRIQSHCSPPVRSLSTRYVVMRFSSEKATKTGKGRWEDIPSDPRPPWVHSTSAGLRLVLIPGVHSVFWPTPYMLKHLEGILLYAVFFADFGDREHVFMPVRRFCAAAWEAKSDYHAQS